MTALFIVLGTAAGVLVVGLAVAYEISYRPRYDLKQVTRP